MEATLFDYLDLLAEQTQAYAEAHGTRTWWLVHNTPCEICAKLDVLWHAQDHAPQLRQRKNTKTSAQRRIEHLGRQLKTERAFRKAITRQQNLLEATKQRYLNPKAKKRVYAAIPH